MEDLRELIRSSMDIREWLARLDTKLDIVADNMADIKEKAESAEDKAAAALAQSQENSRAIAEIKADDRRKWGVIMTTVATLVGSLFLYLVTK